MQAESERQWLRYTESEMWGQMQAECLVQWES